MSVDVSWWTDDAVTAHVGDTRVRIRRNRTTDRWLCDECGERTGRGHCEHTRILSAATADPSKYRPINRKAKA